MSLGDSLDIVRDRHLDGRTIILAAVGLADVLIVVGVLYYSYSTLGHWDSLQALFALLCLTTCSLAVVRGRLTENECTAFLLLLIASATVQSLGFESPNVQWACVYGMSGIPLLALMIARLRAAIVVGTACLLGQLIVVVRIQSSTLELALSIIIVCGAMPVYMGYSVALVRRADALRRKAEVAATTDLLTGLLNRRGMQKWGSKVLSMANEAGSCAAILLLDVDHFKTVNDTYGHDAGDAVLANLGEHLRIWTRHEDVVVRLGGEEFAVLASYGSHDAARTTAERLRSLVTTLTVPEVGQFSVSIGVSFVAGDALGGDPSEVISGLLTRADAALYEAKRNGRNRVVLDDSAC